MVMLLIKPITSSHLSKHVWFAVRAHSIIYSITSHHLIKPRSVPSSESYFYAVYLLSGTAVSVCPNRRTQQSLEIPTAFCLEVFPVVLLLYVTRTCIPSTCTDLGALMYL